METKNKMAKLTSSQGKVIKTHMTHCYDSSGILVNSSNNSKYIFFWCVFLLIQYKEQGDLAFQLLVKSQLNDDPIDLSELMQFSLTPIPHCLGTPDGFFAKTNKATMLHYLLTDHIDEVPYPADAIHIQEGNALIHALKDLPHTFGGLCLKILNQMVSKKN